MSTQNLARTVIEGGRARLDHHLRRHSNAEERAAARVTQATIMQSADADCLLYPLRHGPKRANGFTRSFSSLPEPKRLLEEWLAEVARFRSLPEGIRRERGFCWLSLE
jgi:hypothetical protein